MLCSVISDSATPWTVARQAPVSMGFSGKECWSVLPCPSLVELLDPGIKPASLVSPELQVDFFFFLPLCHQGSSFIYSTGFASFNSQVA